MLYFNLFIILYEKKYVRLPACCDINTLLAVIFERHLPFDSFMPVPIDR